MVSNPKEPWAGCDGLYAGVPSASHINDIMDKDSARTIQTNTVHTSVTYNMIKYHSYAGPVFLASTADIPASRSLGSLMYWRYELCQLPSVWIVESSTHDGSCCSSTNSEAVSQGRPTAVRTSRSCWINQGFRAGCVADRLKNTPDQGPLTAIYLRIAVTGHNGSPVEPTMMSAPIQNWSHLDRFRCNLTIVGFS